MLCLVNIIRIVKYMNSLMSLIKLQKIPTSYGENWSMGGPLILINIIQFVISMDSLILKSLQIIFIAENSLSASDVDMRIIFNVN